MIKAKVNDSKIRKNKSKDGKKEPPGVGGLRKGFDQPEVCFIDQPRAKLGFIEICCIRQLRVSCFPIGENEDDPVKNRCFIYQRNQLVIYDFVYGSGVPSLIDFNVGLLPYHFIKSLTVSFDKEVLIVRVTLVWFFVMFRHSITLHLSPA